MFPTTPPFPPLDNSQYPNQMDYFNDHTSFYPISSAREEFDVYRLPDQPTATEEASYQEQSNTFPNYWGAFEQPGPMIDLPTTLPAMAGNESLLPTNLWTNQPDDYSQPSSSSYCWPEVRQGAQYYYSGSLSQDYSFPGAMVSEPPTMDQIINSAPLNYWGESQSGPSTNTFYTENALTHHQPSTGPTRTELMSARKHKPYERFRVRQSEHRNAEAGPSTLAPPPIPYVGPPTLQPSGGVISETTANAEVQTTAEEDKAPTESKQAKCPRGKGPSRLHRVKMGVENTKLYDWARRRLRLREVPVYNRALAEAVKVIEIIRSPVYTEPCLLVGQGERPETGSKSTRRESRRRRVERRLFQKLSKYYPLEQGQTLWTRPPLLTRVMKDLEGVPPPLGPPNQPPP